MLKIWNAHNFRRTLAGLCLIVSPLLLVIAFGVGPTDPSTADTLTPVAANRTGMIIQSAVFLLSTILLVPALFCLVHLLSHRGVILEPMSQFTRRVSSHERK
jgi:hypothetical protein